MLQLYSYFRSSAAYRLRIALHLKGLAFDTVPVHLLKGGGEQLQSAYRAINPAALVPALNIDADNDGTTLTQSLAIMEYLDETHPQPPLLPADALGRARVRALALTVACDIHPLNNLRVLTYLSGELQASGDARNAWARHWMALGFATLEQHLANDAATGLCCHGDTPTLADCCVVPQVFNARRFELDLAPYPTLVRIAEHCEALPAFIAAHPAQQPDAASIARPLPSTPTG
ncbi:MAG: maleylacetoacetate isomerase [Giesbergeria sp.]|nr:maleylacetoacetate isomerase [Giesbergeria sp.]MBP6322116.1 maleylacetoacetate isomerase [Giesbergeria sp.]MBP7916628.1 maleylacetoacetate isomerase [Giesbergeria sp.]MBP8029064.1 maleylacetoacetate isomerase [Giesbergeria sp.]